MRSWRITPVLSIVLMAVLIPCCIGGCQEEPLEFTIVYEESMGLAKDAPVLYKGEIIGKVLEAKLGPREGGGGGVFRVRVQIEPDYAGVLDRQMIYEVRGKSWFSKEKQIFVQDSERKDYHEPVTPGTVVNGYDGDWALALEEARKLMEEAKGTLVDAGEGVRDFTDRLEKALDEGADDRTIERLSDELEELAEKASDVEKEILEKLEKQMDKLRGR